MHWMTPECYRPALPRGWQFTASDTVGIRTFVLTSVTGYTWTHSVRWADAEAEPGRTFAEIERWFDNVTRHGDAG